MTIAEQSILITGASRGIGAYLARYFAPRAAHTAIVARDGDAIDRLAGELSRDGNRVDAFACDLRDSDALRELVERRLTRPIDVLINNAADTTSKPFRETSLEEIDSLIRTNVTGPLQLARLVAPGMQQRGGGAIVNLSSLAGYKSNPTQTVYSISKGAVNAMSDGLRRELGPLGISGPPGIRVINLALPSVSIDGIAQPGAIPVERVARTIERAISGQETAEVFFSPVSRWLMRAYRAFRGLPGDRV